MMLNKESSTYKTSFNLNRIEIYVTHFQFSFQRFDIHLKYIIINVMLEMLFWKSITVTFNYWIVQKLIKSIFEMKSYFLKMSSDSDFQHICHDSSLARLSLLALPDLFSLRHLD